MHVLLSIYLPNYLSGSRMGTCICLVGFTGSIHDFLVGGARNISGQGFGGLVEGFVEEPQM